MSRKITIHWGSDKEPQDKKSYTFENDEQLKYFMMGVDEANGWLEYEVIAANVIKWQRATSSKLDNK